MSKLSSFVFFDLETTGLPGIKCPKVTEIALYACSKNHLLDSHENGKKLPRILHKQTICLNPRRVIDPKASETTGLFNDMLEQEAPFDEKTGQLIVLFLERLQRPACLVAHNGNRFDFVILKKELDGLNIKLPDDIYCVDSFPLFKHLEKIKEQNEKVAEENELAELEFSAVSAMQELESSQDALAQMQKLNEMTPQKSKVQVNFKKALRSYLEVTPTQDPESSKNIAERANRPRSKRQLFANSEVLKNPSLEDESPSGSTKSVRKKYRLCDIYERIFKEQPKQSHYAECDVHTLIKCAIAEGEAFVAYAEEHCVKFVDFSGKF
ncbi:DNA polymerase III PolC-type [Sabethes cyaneus]|uniref:DNA polymerase III PolC-type n=1 Tax=Sabethes cyaneus TaxID=53552 RepID=UPI00237E8284|nr:DNA polymerase III PolC-type [Sabethes cyaneus]